MELVEMIERSDYEGFLEARPEANFLQSWQWGSLHKSLGDKVVRCGVKDGSKLVGVWTGIIKDARRGRYLEVPGGPLIDWSNSELVSQAMRSLRDIAKRYRCVFVRMRPQQEESDDVFHILSGSGAKRSPMHLHAEHTNILDISADEDEILAGMRRQTRYEVRRVEKRGVKIESRTPTEADINEFYGIQMDTAKRHHFIQSPLSFFQAMRVGFSDDIKIYRATKDGELLNLAIVIRSGEEADYYEAASTIEARKEPGAYGIVWQAVREARQAGCTRFNFWGIAYSDDPNHRYAGVTTFKRGFGGRDVAYVPAHDIVIKPVRYGINWLVETIRRKKRGL